MIIFQSLISNWFIFHPQRPLVKINLKFCMLENWPQIVVSFIRLSMGKLLKLTKKSQKWHNPSNERTPCTGIISYPWNLVWISNLSPQILKFIKKDKTLKDIPRKCREKSMIKVTPYGDQSYPIFKFSQIDFQCIVFQL